MVLSKEECIELKAKLEKFLIPSDGEKRVTELVDILSTLKEQMVTVDTLKKTQIGVTVSRLRKHADERASNLAKTLVLNWKALLDKSSSGSGHSVTKKLEALEVLNSPKLTTSITFKEEYSPLSSPKDSPQTVTIKNIKMENINKVAPATQIKNSNNNIPVKIEVKEVKTEIEDNGVKKVNGSLSSKKETPKGDFPKTGNSARDHVRNLYYDAFYQRLKDEVGEVERIGQVIANVEDGMFTFYKDVSRDYKQKFTSLLTNFKDATNIALVKSVMSGEYSGKDLCEMSSKQLASDEVRQKHEAISKEKARHKTILLSDNQPSTDQFRCGKCKQYKTTYYQLQTRSADEPMTTFITCTVCGNRWKM